MKKVESRSYFVGFLMSLRCISMGDVMLGLINQGSLEI